MKKNSLLTNIRNKCVIRKINLYFFDVMKNDQIFSSKVCYFHNMITDSILVEKWEKSCKNLLNLDCQDSIRFGINQVAYK